MADDLEQQPVTIEGTGIELDSTVEDIASSMMPQDDEVVAADPSEQPAQEGATETPAAASPEAEKVAATVQPGTVDTDVAPDTWRKEAKEAWATLPPVVKEEMRKRESDIASYVEQHKQPVAIGVKLNEIIAPYLPMFEQTQTDPWENMRAMFQIQERLMNGSPEQKLAIVQGFAQQAGVKFENGQFTQAPDATGQYVKQLEARIGQLEGAHKSVAHVVQEARLGELQENIRKFAGDTEAHPHFYAVADEITHLIKTGAARNLDHAYRMAVAADPVIQQKEIDRATAKALEARTKAEKERADKARTVTKHRVRSTTSGATVQPLGNIEDTIKSTLAEIQSR